MHVHLVHRDASWRRRAGDEGRARMLRHDDLAVDEEAALVFQRQRAAQGSGRRAAGKGCGEKREICFHGRRPPVCRSGPAPLDYRVGHLKGEAPCQETPSVFTACSAGPPNASTAPSSTPTPWRSGFRRTALPGRAQDSAPGGGGTGGLSFKNSTPGGSHSFGGRYLELKPNE